VKVFWQWDRQRITQLVRACIWTGYRPKVWKTAKGVVIPRPGKPDYAKVRAYRVISLLDVIGKLVERTAAHLIGDHLERKRALHEGQYSYRKRRSYVDTIAVLINHTQQTWASKKMVGALFVGVNSAFNKSTKRIWASACRRWVSSQTSSVVPAASCQMPGETRAGR